jgi:hypothetical protein
MNAGGASGGNLISPAAPVSVQSGGKVTFTLTAVSGYAVTGVAGTCGGTLTGNTYTTNAVTANCTVIVTFAQLVTGSAIAPCFTVDGVVEFNVANEGLFAPNVMADRSKVETSALNNITTQTVFYTDGTFNESHWQVTSDGIRVLRGVSPADIANPVLTLPVRMQRDQFVDYAANDGTPMRLTFLGITGWSAGTIKFTNVCYFQQDGLLVGSDGARTIDPRAIPVISSVAPGLGYIEIVQDVSPYLGWLYDEKGP